MRKTQALKEFWSSFGLKAYEEYSVPSAEHAPAFPYITYEVSIDSFNHPVALTASLNYYSTSLTEISKKAQEISSFIGESGVIDYCDGGALWIKRGHPFAFPVADPADKNIKRMSINITAEFLTAD